jgi:hypothetical protein
MFSIDMIDAIKVQFLQPIFEDDFPERGMVAWLTAIEWVPEYECYKLHFNFEDFEEQNKKYFKAVYYPNKFTKDLERRTTGRKQFTALEAGQYTPVYNVLFFVENRNENTNKLNTELQQYLKIVN